MSEECKLIIMRYNEIPFQTYIYLITRNFSVKKNQSKMKLQPQEESVEQIDDIDDDNSKDWWTKYFNSYEKLIEDSKMICSKLEQHHLHDDKKKFNMKGTKLVAKLSPKHLKKQPTSGRNIAMCHVRIYQIYIYLLDFVY